MAGTGAASIAAEPGRLYAATSGNGTFVTTVPTVPPQPVLGGSLRVTNPNPGDPSRRKVVLSAKQQNVAAPLDRDAFVSGGATLSVQLAGELPTSQTFVLPAPWVLSGTTAVKYVDPKGVHGPVKSVVLKQSSTGTLSLSVQIVGNTGSAPQPHVVLVPPNPGTSARAVLSSGTGTWCIGFGGANGGIVKNTPTLFSIAKATTASCS